MRPDEHKKKRSNQYKKKHNIPPSKRDPGQDRIEKNKDERKSKLEEASSEVDKPGGDSTTIQNKNEFPKRRLLRQIESNWDRYNIDEQDSDGDGLRGEDFQVLIRRNDGVDSQFRFKDELGWDQDQDVDDDEGDTGGVAIDFNTVAAALQCVPLYERLNIDKSLFQEEQILQMEESARLNTVLYKQTQDSKMNDIPQKIESPDTKEISVLNRTEGKENVSEKSISTDANHICMDFDKKSPTENLEEDLDYLLSLDVPSKTVQNSEEKETSLKDKKHPYNSQLEDWLDSVLDD